MVIAYCDKCGMRVPEADLSGGTAAKLDEARYLCAKCASVAPSGSARKSPTKMIARQAVAAALGTQPSEAQPPAPARRSTGAIVLPGRAASPAAPAASSSARGAAGAAKAQSASQAGNPLPWIVGVVGGAVFLLGLIVAFSGKKDEPPARKNAASVEKQPVTVPVAPPKIEVAQPKIEVAQPPPVIAQNTPLAQPANPANPADRAKAADKEMESLRNDRAARMLEEHKAWFAGHPQDPWTYKERMDALATTYRSSPAGVEAAKIVAELKVPEGEFLPDSLIWHRAWEITPGAKVEMNENMDGRKFVLATHPIEMGKPFVLARKWKVPDDKTILEFSGRAHDAGDFLLMVVVSGRTLLAEVLRGREWRTFDCDLTALKGQEAEISIQHHNTEWENEHGWWQAPRFVERPSVGARIVRWDSAIAQAALPPDDAWRNAVDLLPLVDTAKDTASGSWALKPGEGLVSGKETYTKIEFPYQPPEEYDYRIVFTRRNSPKNECITQVMAKNGHDFTYVMAGFQNKVSGFELIGGKRCSDNRTGVRNWGWLQNGRKYTSVVQVRNDGVRALLDGKLICQWATDFSDMSQSGDWGMRSSGILALGTYDSECCFESVQVLEVTGKGKAGRGGVPVAVAAATGSQQPIEAARATADTRAWKPLFDGKTLDGLRGKGVGAWRVENGALVSEPGNRMAAQTKFDFEDGDVRARFEVQDCTYMQFTARQSEEGGFSAEFDRGRLPGMLGKQHELVFMCRGENVSATLDGQPFPVGVRGRARKGTLQFHARDGTLRVHSIEFAEAGAAAAATGSQQPTEAARTTPGVVTVAKAAPLDPAAEAKVEYEKMLADVYGLLLKNAVRPAQARLEQAKADGKLAAMRAAIELDVQCAKYAEELGAAVAKGVQALADKRAFVFRKADNKETAVGQGSKNSVLSIKDEQIEIEMDLGGGAKAGMKVPVELLSPETRLGLAKIGIAAAPDAELKTAFASLLLLQGGVGEVTPKMVRVQLDAAKKAGAAADRVAHIAGRLEAREHEAAADAALKKLDALQKDKKWPESKAALENLRKEFGDTLFLAKQQAELDKQAAEIEFQLNPARPGLWASYWSGDGTGDKFKTMHFARAETKLCWDLGEGSPDAKVPKDNFAVKWTGKLRIERDGRYRLKGDADDRVWIWIDGKKVIDKNEQEVPLTAGEHDFKVVYEEDSGGARVWIQWKLEGGFDWQEIPPNLMSYDPRQIERYQKD